MNATAALGLSPTRDAILHAVASQDSTQPVSAKTLDALEFIGLGRGEGDNHIDRTFSFSHRRIQEYFATCVVLRHAERVPVDTLLHDGRWRETTVVLLSLGPPEIQQRLIESARTTIADSLRNLGIPGPHPERAPVNWPAGLMHLLSLLQDGFAGREERLPSPFRELVAEVVARIFSAGTLLDRRWALELSGAGAGPALAGSIESALNEESHWLHSAAYDRLSRSAELAQSQVHHLREMIVDQYRAGASSIELRGMQARLLRISRSGAIRDTFSLVNAIRYFDVIVHLAVLSYAASASAQYAYPPLGFGVVALAAVHSLHLLHSGSSTWMPMHSWLTRSMMPRVALCLIVAHQAGPVGFATTFLGGKLISSMNYWVFSMCLYSLSWAPVALWAIAADWNLNRLRWPIFPLAGVFRGCLVFAKEGFGSRSALIWSMGVLGGLLGVLVVGLALFVALLLAVTLTFGPIAGGMVLWLPFAGGLVEFLWSWVRPMFDELRVRRLLARTRTFDAEGLLAALDSFSSIDGKVGLLRRVRKESLLVNSTDARENLLTFAVKTEAALQTRKTMKKWTKTELAAAEVDRAVLDEICVLLDLLRHQADSFPRLPLNDSKGVDDSEQSAK